VPNAKVAISVEKAEAVVGRDMSEIGDKQAFLDSLEFNFLLDPTAVLPFFSRKNSADEIAKAAWIKEQFAAWAASLNSPDWIKQTEIMVAGESKTKNLSKFLKLLEHFAGGKQYVLATENGTGISIAGGVLIVEKYQKNPANRNKALGILIQKAQAVYNARNVLAAEEILEKNMAGLEGDRNRGFSITNGSMSSVFGNLQAIFKAFQKIAAAA
jgi:hypothetical protein